MYVDDASLLIWCIAPVALWFLQKAHIKYGISIFKNRMVESAKVPIMLLTNPISGLYHSALMNNQRDAALTTTILPVSGFARTAQNSLAWS